MRILTKQVKVLGNVKFHGNSIHKGVKDRVLISPLRTYILKYSIA